MLETGFEVDRYIIEEILGEGGMAMVYRVRHRTLGTRHALKVLTVRSRQVKERLVQEGRVQATLRHPNVVAVTDVIEVGDAPGLLMEFVRGPPLDVWLHDFRPSLEDALTLFRGIVTGVGHAHGKGLIHRDLKPGNVMLDVTDQGIVAKVTDFGLAKLTDGGMKKTRTGATMGTPAYMAPEQISDASSVDRRADLYSLGCILYELVCGRTPYDDENLLTLFTLVAKGDYPDPREFTPDLPDNVVECIRALVTVDPNDRLTDCAGILEILGGQERTYIKAEGHALAPPRSLPNVGRTTLSLEGAGGDRAMSMVREITSVEPTQPRLSIPPSSPTAAPTVGFDGGAQSVTTLSPAPPQASSKGLIGMIALLLVILVFVITAGATVVGVLLLDDDTNTPVNVDGDTPEPTPQPDEPTPQPDEPTPQPDEPTPQPDQPTPQPVKPTPQPVKPTPSPQPRDVVAPKPKPRPTPRPQPEPDAPTTGTFTFSGAGVQDVKLQGPSKQYSVGQAVPPGVYSLVLNGRGVGGNIRVRAGRNTTLKCSDLTMSCRAR